MELLQALVLALVQGLTEFLPISSSAHLILAPVLLGWEDQGLAFDVATHIGSLGAVMVYFRADLARMTGAVIRGRGRPVDPETRLFWWVVIGTLPAGVAGLLLADAVATSLRAPLVIAVTTIVFGLALGWADRRGGGARSEWQMQWRDALLIGCAQALALIPGTSRSGITMTAALLLGLSREGAARFSFWLSMPIIALAGGYATLELVLSSLPVDWTQLAVGVLASFVAAYGCIAVFLTLIARIGFTPFVIYRLILGVVLFAVFL